MVCFRKLENPFYDAMKICVFLNLLSAIDIKTGIDMSLSSSLNSAPWIATGIIIISIINNRAVNGVTISLKTNLIFGALYSPE